ncbi:MAG: hypothetical protein ACQEW9_10645 [Bacteroidota bacterium]
MSRISLIMLLLLSTVSGITYAQSSEQRAAIDSLKQVVLQLDQDLYQVELNLHQSQKQLKTGIFIATVGYTVTIVGGQLLGRNPDLGEALLYAGGATGIVGTVVLVNGFKKISLGKPRSRVLISP